MKKSVKKVVSKRSLSGTRKSGVVKGWRARLGVLSEGLSILLSMILITVIVLFSVGVTTLVIDSARQSSNVKEGTTAYYAAEAGLEQALWINKKLSDAGAAMGAQVPPTDGSVGGGVATVKYNIQGTTANLLEKTVNGKYIIPFPWTGDAPWHGEGAVAGTGGCAPQKPPQRSGSGNAKIFEYTYKDANQVEHKYPAEEQYHPCNWNKLAVGEKATIPLYGKGTNGMQNFTSFTLLVRTPCAFGNEMCPKEGNVRLELNCFDKGDSAIKCTSNDDNFDKQKKKGEVTLIWQIDAKDSGGNVVNMLPRQAYFLFASLYIYSQDSQLFEGRLNSAFDGVSTNFFEALNASQQGVVGQTIPEAKQIPSFLSDADLHEPVLKLSVVGDLIGCYGLNGYGTDCSNQYDLPEDSLYKGVFKIPYIEYQVVLPANAATFPPVSPNNIITAEGQSGPFVQSIQVKAPNDETGLEYVIQQ